MDNLKYKLTTWLRLGLGNIFVVALYRLAKRFGYYRYRFPVGSSLSGPFLSDDVAEAGGCLCLSYFSYHNIEVSSPMIDTESGDAPNLGSNDGAYLFNLSGADYRDFRPSLQLGAAVFFKRSAWEDQIGHPLLELFDLDISEFSGE